MTYLLIWLFILNNVDDFSDFKLEFVHVLGLIFVSGLHLVEDAGWKVVSGGACVETKIISCSLLLVFKINIFFHVKENKPRKC